LFARNFDGEVAPAVLDELDALLDGRPDALATGGAASL
jgi:hypothetical protein